MYRVDHYLGMSTVLNILGLRFANRMFEPVLNAEHVQTIDIVFDESLGLEGRAGTGHRMSRDTRAGMRNAAQLDHARVQVAQAAHRPLAQLVVVVLERLRGGKESSGHHIKRRLLSAAQQLHGFG